MTLPDYGNVVSLTHERLRRCYEGRAKTHSNEPREERLRNYLVSYELDGHFHFIGIAAWDWEDAQDRIRAMRKTLTLLEEVDDDGDPAA